MKKCNEIILIENVNDCSLALKAAKGVNAQIIALSAEVKAALADKEIKCSFLDDGLHNIDLNSMGTKNLDITAKVCDYLDTAFQQEIALWKKSDIRVFNAMFFKVKVFLDSVYSAFYTLEEFFKRNAGKEYIIFQPMSLT